MKQAEPSLEFSRPLDVARVPRLGSFEKLSADSRECQDLAKRLKIPVIHHLSAELKAKPWRGGGLKVTGQVQLDLEQVSVVSLEHFRQNLRFEVERFFLHNVPQDATDDEDIDPIANGFIDLGEVVAETIALDLDLYPRKPGEAFGEQEIEPIKSPNPFAALKIVK